MAVSLQQTFRALLSEKIVSYRNNAGARIIEAQATVYDQASNVDAVGCGGSTNIASGTKLGVEEDEQPLNATDGSCPRSQAVDDLLEQEAIAGSLSINRKRANQKSAVSKVDSHRFADAPPP